MGRFCPNCGKESAREDEIFCSNCGNNLNETYQAQPIQNDNIVYQYEQKNGVVTKDIAKSESQKKKEEKIILTITFTFSLSIFHFHYKCKTFSFLQLLILLFQIIVG